MPRLGAVRDREFMVLMLLAAAAMAGNGIIVPVMPEYGRMFSDSSALVGMLITIFGLARMLSNLPAGFATRYCSSRKLMVGGHVLLALGAFGAAMAQNMGVLLVCRFIQGTGSGIFLTTASAYIAGRAAPEVRGRVMANYQAAVFAGAGVGPMIGGLLAAHLGLRAPFWAYGMASVLGVVLAMRMTDMPIPAKRRDGARGRIWTPTMAANMAMSFSSGFARTAALWHSIPLVAVAGYGMGLDKVGLAASVTALANFLVLPISGAAVDRIGSRILPPISAAIFAAALLIIGFGGSEAMFWAGAVLAGLAGGLNGPSLATALAETYPQEMLGPAFGLQRSAGDLGFVLGPILVGSFSDLLNLSPHYGLAITAGVLALSVVVWQAIYAVPRAAS